MLTPLWNKKIGTARYAHPNRLFFSLSGKNLAKLQLLIFLDFIDRERGKEKRDGLGSLKANRSYPFYLSDIRRIMI